MAEQIIDGSGTGNRAKVGKDNRLQTRSISTFENIYEAEGGNAYNLNTGLISVSGDATLQYFKNNSDLPFIIEAVALAAFDGITHTDAPYITLVRNPTGGDLITDATPIDMNQNRNFGSSKTPDADIYKGKTGGTLTGGDDIGIFLTGKTGRSFFGINFFLTKGSSIGIKLTSYLDTGSANYYCAIIGYFEESF